MVSLPPVFIATKYPGYFYNSSNEQLYSLKIDGILKPLKYQKPNRFNHMFNWRIKLKDGSYVYTEGGYYVSTKGRKKFYPIEELKELEQHDATIPVKEEK